MAKGKSTHVYVMLKSALSKHMFPVIKLRGSQKLEATKFDPFAQKFSLYKELRKTTKNLRE